MILTDKNFYIFAANNYNNYNCVDDNEFLEDLERFKYIKKLITTYKKKGEIRDRLILNHLVILYNVFNPEALTKMLILKCEDSLDILIPFLKILNYFPNEISNIKYKNYKLELHNIQTDNLVEQQLDKSLKNIKELL